ncbi:hemagglutinin repeat-containing protein, partial [Pseudomonas sp. MEJ086]
GVGVKLAGDMAASAGDIQIDANGLLTLNTAAASGQIAARAESVETQGQVYAGTQLEVQARDSLVNRGSLAARDRVALTGGARLLNEGHVEAGVNADDSRNRAGNVALAGERIRNAGSVVASHDLRVAAEGLLDNRDGQLLAEGNARIDSTQLDNHKGRIVADGNLALRSGQVDNAQGRIAAGQTLGVNATGLAQQGGVLSSGAGLSVDLAGGNLDNRAGLVNAGQALRIDSAAKVDNTAGEISSRQGVQVAAASLDNQGGKLLAETSLALTGERLQNRAGRIAANADLQLVHDDIDNRGGTVSSRARVTIAAQGLDNSDQGKVIGAHLVLTTQRLLNRSQGLIHGQGNTQVAGAWLDNSGGSLSAGEDLRVELAARGELDGGLINTDGLLGSEGALNVGATRLDNRRGDVSSVRDLNLTLLGALNNQEGRVLGDAALHLRSGDLSNDQGLISAGSTLALHAAQIANRKGRIAATGPLELTANGLQQQGGELFSKTSLALDLQGGALDNDAGFINAPGALRLDGLGVVSNRGGEISSRQGFDLAASSLDNRSGKLISEQDLRVSVSGSLDNRGGSLAGRQVEVSAAALDNGADGLLRSQGRLDVGVSGTLANQGGELLAEGDLNLLAQRLDNQKGRVAANGPLSVTAGDIDNRGGEISSRGSAGLNVTTLDNSDGGRLLAAHLNLAAARLINRDEGLIFGRDQLQLGAAHLNNSGGTLASDTRVLIELAARTGDLAHDGQLINNAGTISSEGTLNVTAATLDNSAGSLSSAGALQVTSQGALLNQQGRLLTDAGLLLRSAGLDNRHGQISAVEHLSVITGRFDNDGGRLTGNANLDLQADQIGNAQGRIAASGPLSVQASGLAQQGGELFSQTSLTLDLDGGYLNNDAGLLHAPGQLLLNNLGAVSNRGGEISSGQGFNLLATRLDNANGRLLSEQNLTLRIQGVLTNLAGLISARGIDLRAKELSNEAGTLFARGDLVIDLTGNLSNASKGLIQSAGDLRLNSGTLTNTDGTLLASKALELRSNGALDNRDGGLINSQGTLTLDAASLDSSQGGEVSAKGDLQLTLDRLTQQQGALIGESSISLDLRQGDLDNRQGLISSNGPLTLSNLRAVDNAAGEISSLGVLDLAAASLDNRNGRLISRQWLRLSLGQGDNRGGLLSGWQGLQLSGGSLDNRQRGTLSSRDGGLAVALAGALLNSGEGALVAADRLDIQAESLDNSDRGILSSGAGQRLQITRQLDNRAGQIDAGERLVIDATSVANAGGLLQAQQDLTLSSKALDNSHGRIAASGAATLNVDGTLSNAAGQLASAGPLSITADTLNNQGGTLASQSTAKLVVSELDNSGSATLAANGALELGVAQALNNSADGLIYSRDAQVNLNAASLDNSGGAIQGQGDLLLNIGGALNNQAGTLQSRSGAVDLTAASLDNRQGTLTSLEGWVRTRLSAWLRNGAIGQGGLIQGQHIDLQVAGNLDNTAGRIHALNGAATLRASAFDNQRGTLHAQGDLLLRGGDLNNQSGTLGAATITLEQATDALLDNQQGIIESRGTLHVQGGSLNNQGGQLRALGSTGTTFFTLGALLDNRGGTLETANRDLTLNLGSLLNHNGKLLHAGGGEFGVALAQVAAAGGSFVTQGGLTLKADSWSNDSILQAGHLTLDIGTFEQTANGQLLATGSLTGKGGNWINHGLIASDGPISLTLSGAYSGNGRVTSQGALDLAAASLSLSEAASITAAGAASFMLGGALLNQGRLTAADNLTLSAASVNNAGTLGSAQRLTLSTPSLINEKGLLFSGDDMALYVDTFTNRYADVYSLGTLLIAGDQAGEQSSRFENVSSTVESAGDLAVNALAIINRKDAFAVSERLVSGSITYECLDCKGRHFDFYYFLNEQIERTVSSDSPASLIQAGGNLKLTGSTIENSHSTISAAGNILLVGDQVSNLGSATESVNRYRQYRNPVDSERRAVFESLISANGDIYQYNRNNAIYEHTYVIRQAREPDIYLRPDRQVTRTPNRYYNPGAQYPVPAIFSTYSLVDSVDTVTSTGVAAGAVIQAGGNVTVQSANVIENGVRRNGQSIAPGTSRAGDTSSGGSGSTTVIRLNPQLPADLAQQQVNPLNLPGFSLPTGQNGLFRLSGQSGSDSQVREAVAAQQWALAGTSLEQAQREGSGAVRIEDVRGDQSGQLQAGLGQPVAVDRPSLVIQPGTQVTVSASAAQGGAGNPVSQAQGVIVNPVARPHKYLIETNPALTELSRFLSSDYMLGQLGYDPDQAQKRLGDGLYEQRLIREAIVARTGQRYLAGLTSDEAMFRYLMNNAIASKDALNLGLGVSLSAQQVAALTHDIVWMEEQEVLGEKVLVPVLYLAQAEGRLAPNGALIQGRDVALIGGGDLSNQGTLRASGALDVQGRNIANSGLMQANERLQLLATESIRNAQGGIIAGRDVSLIAREGDIVNERSVTQHAASIGSHRWGQTHVDSAARIEASESLSLAAGRDVSNLGSVLDSRGDLAIQAGRDVTVASVQEGQYQTRGNWFVNERVTQVGAEVSAGRDLDIAAGRDLGVVASRVTAGRDLELGAERDLMLSSAADESHFLSRGKKVTQSRDQITQQSSEIQAGRDISLGAGNDLSVIASRVQAGNDVDIDAGQDIDILSAKDESASYYFKKSKGSFGRSKSRQSESYDSTNIASVIEAGNDLTINTSKAASGALNLEGGRDVTVIGSQLSAGNDLLVGGTGDVAVLSGVEEHGSYAKKTKSGFLGLSKSGKSQLQTSATQVASELEAGNDVVIAAGNDIRLRASTTDAGNDVELRAGLVKDTGDINLVSANDEAYSRSESYRKKFGLSARDAVGVAVGSPSWGGDIAISSAKKSGQEIIRSTNVGSQVNAERDASLIAERDINVVGSGVSAGRNVLLDAGRDVNVVAGSGSEQVTSWKNTKTLGLMHSADGNGVSAFAGAESLKDKTRTSEQTAAASQINAGLDLDVRAGRDIRQQGSDMQAGYDLNMKAGRDIVVDAAREQSSIEREQSQNRSGVGVTVNHNFERTKNAVSGAGKGENTVSQASSTLKAVDSVSQFLAGPTFDAHFGSTSQRQSVSQTVVGNRASTLDAGNDINLEAGNDVQVRGAQFHSGRDIN